MAAPAPSVLLTDQASIVGLLSEFGVTLAVDDDQSGAADSTEQGWITTAINVGSATVLRYCQPLYDGDDLKGSASVWEWATVLASVRLRRRRMNPLPEELLAYRDEVMADLRVVYAGEMKVEDIGERTTDAPGWSVQTLDPRYRGKQLRVQRRMSEQTPRQRPVARDMPGEFFGAEEPWGG